MTLEEFQKSTKHSEPPKVSVLLLSLWYDAQGDWGKSHALAREINTSDGSWIHAYLHRKEGDKFNAQYWYNRANRKMPDYSPEEEWKEIAEALLNG
ncbi:MAG: hypothetical protein ABL895_17905 [Cyclobacteriaceae bacterium]